MYIDLTVLCERDGFRKEKIYYLCVQNCLLFNGCENSCGSKDCVDCGKIHYEEARERFMRITEPYIAIDN